MNSVCINSKPLEVKVWEGQKVVTFKDIDLVHQRAEGTANRNFRKNKKHFIEGEDYFEISSDEIRRNKLMTISQAVKRAMIFITETGYLMLVKSFTDDLAWKVQRQLVKNYFRIREPEQLQIEEPKELEPKYLNGVPHMTVKDVEQVTGMTEWRIHRFLEKHNLGLMLRGEELSSFKEMNANVSEYIASLVILNRTEVEMVCKGLKVYDRAKETINRYFRAIVEENKTRSDELREQLDTIRKAESAFSYAVDTIELCSKGLIMEDKNTSNNIVIKSAKVIMMASYEDIMASIRNISKI